MDKELIELLRNEETTFLLSPTAFAALNKSLNAKGYKLLLEDKSKEGIVAVISPRGTDAG